MEVQNPKVAISTISESKTAPAVEVRPASEIQAWMVSYLADLLEVDPDELNVTIPFDRYGLDSSVAVGMTGDLETWLGTKLDPTLLYDYPTIESLAQHLADELKAR
jgi:acyl carrier protein